MRLRRERDGVVAVEVVVDLIRRVLVVEGEVGEALDLVEGGLEGLMM